MKAKEEVIFRHKCGGVTYRIHYWWGYLYQSHGYGEDQLTLKALRSLGINYRVNELGNPFTYGEDFLSSSLGKDHLLEAIAGYEFPQEPTQTEILGKELQYYHCRLKYAVLMSPVNDEDDTFDF